MRLNKDCGAAALIGLSLCFFPINGFCGESSGVIDRFHAALISIMKAPEGMLIDQRYKTLQPTIAKAFNFRFMVRLTSGRHWGKANKEDQANLVNAFERMSVSMYVSRFNSYSGQSFEILGEKNGPNKTKMVYSRLISPGSKPVKLTYILRKFSSSWKVIDILLGGGISEVAMRASEYRRILSVGGIKALAFELEKKTVKLSGK